MGASGWVFCEVEEVIRETDAAFLLTIDAEDYWIPKSCIDRDDLAVGDKGITVGILERMAKEKGLD